MGGSKAFFTEERTDEVNEDARAGIVQHEAVANREEGQAPHHSEPVLFTDAFHGEREGEHARHAEDAPGLIPMRKETEEARLQRPDRKTDAGEI